MGAVLFLFPRSEGRYYDSMGDGHSRYQNTIFRLFFKFFCNSASFRRGVETGKVISYKERQGRNGNDIFLGVSEDALALLHGYPYKGHNEVSFPLGQGNAQCPIRRIL